MVVEDVLQDVCFYDNLVVVGDLYICFYVGVLLISFDGLLLGMLCVFDVQLQYLVSDKVEVLVVLLWQVMLVMELCCFVLDIQNYMLECDDYECLLLEYYDVLLVQNVDLVEQSCIDVLIGLLNCCVMVVVLDEVVVVIGDQFVEVCVVLLDIDYFKYINDFQGYVIGDCVLVELGVLLCLYFVGCGMVVCYGGEEFVVVMFVIDLCIVEFQCEFLCLVVVDLLLGFLVMISIGIVQYQFGESVDDMLVCVDKVLYWVKGNGCNRVEVVG